LFGLIILRENWRSTNCASNLQRVAQPRSPQGHYGPEAVMIYLGSPTK
jgi:hypothetical protein